MDTVEISDYMIERAETYRRKAQMVAMTSEEYERYTNLCRAWSKAYAAYSGARTLEMADVPAEQEASE